ncbi:MAG: arylsulfotransferase family protein [Myxococcota bacterium]
MFGALALAASAQDLPGRWYPDAYPANPAEISALESLGYVGAYEPDDAVDGVVRWDRDRAYAAPSLYSSGHAAEALLIAMDGRVLHRWRQPFHQAFPGLVSSDVRATGAWRRVALRVSDGHLLGVYEGLGLVHLDARSRTVWATADRAHHDARWRPDGGVWTLTRSVRPGAGPAGQPLLEDCVSELDPSGREVNRVSVWAALRASPWAALLDRAPTDTGDPMHTNALFPLDAVKRTASGIGGPRQVLLSMRHLDALAVLDLDREQIVWATTGPWRRQHDAEITPTGALMLFDNRGGPGGTSRVLRFTPWSMDLVGAYGGSDGQRLVSEVLGAAQELPNGHLLVTESTRGRALEVTPNGEVVWDFRNPEVAGDLRAAIFELIRLPAEAVTSWVSAR